MGPRIRTGYSFRAAAGTIPNVIAKLKECGYTYAPITDRASTFGFVEWHKAATKAGLQPVFGVELAVTAGPEDKKPVVDYWTFIATDSLAPLNELVTVATQQFRYEPLLTYTQALAACGKLQAIAGRRVQLQHMPQQHPGLWLAAAPSASPALLRAGMAHGLPLVACSDNFYPNKDDLAFYQVLVGRNASVQTWAQHILNKDEWLASMRGKLTSVDCEQALAAAETIMACSTATIRKSKILHPERTQTLRELCEAGAATLGLDLLAPEYAARLDRELSMIAEKQFEDYFYIVGDLVRWARTKMTVGPARGSSAGSLVCYLLGITTIDPLKYDLLFERFLDITRTDWPDIDIDFSDVKRDMVFDYLKQKYGNGRVAQLGAVAIYKAASAIKEAAGAMNVPLWETEATMQSIIKRSGGDARQTEALGEAMRTTEPGRKLLAKYPEIEIAARLEGHPRHYSRHAAGVILTDEDVTNFVAVDARTGGVHCNKKDAEALDILKIDALGLKQLSVFEDCLRLIGKPHDWLDTLPLDDPAAFAVLNTRKVAGIFQFLGATIRSVASTFNFTSLEDLIALTALARPGPLGNGAAFSWIKRKNGSEHVALPHPLFEPYTRGTFGVIVYQEQVMQICRLIGGMSWDDVTSLRKAMGKNLGKDYFDGFGDKFKEGAAGKGIPKETIDKVWEDMGSYGNNTFNRSHAVAYGIVSYYCAWLKAHHPLEFAAATLQAETDPEQQIIFLRELNAEGMNYVPVHPELSTDRWTIQHIDDERKIVGPLQMVKGIGPKMIQQIMSAKARGEPMPERAAKLLVNCTTAIDSLWPIRDNIQRLIPDLTTRNIYTKPETVHDLINGPMEREVLLLMTPARLNKKDENEGLNVAKRGFELTDGKTTSLNIQMQDDTGVLFGKVNRFKYEDFGRPIAERGRLGKALYAVKGRIWGSDDFRGVSIEAVRYLGDMEGKAE